LNNPAPAQHEMKGSNPSNVTGKSCTSFLSKLKTLPSEVAQHIYEYDTTYKELFKKNVIDNYDYYHIFHEERSVMHRVDLDRHHVVRNFIEPWAITPKYVIKKDGKWIVGGRNRWW
jgi:hypothetical protein